MERLPVGGQDLAVVRVVEIPLDGGELRIEVDDDSAWHLEQPHVVSVLLHPSWNLLYGGDGASIPKSISYDVQKTEKARAS